MIPLIVDIRETKPLLAEIREGISDATENVYFHNNLKQEYQVGVMLETPRACLQSYALADVCDFFSFGTNDLTQTTWALSRDDGAKFMGEYAAKGLVDGDPFVSLDTEGVGVLMGHAVDSIGDRRSKVKIGICGEHGGDSKSIDFCHTLGLDYVSCSPFRILVARMAVAHATLKDKQIPGLAVQEIAIEPPIVTASIEVKDLTDDTNANDDLTVKDWVKLDPEMKSSDVFDKYSGWEIGITNYPDGCQPTTIKGEKLVVGKLIGQQTSDKTWLLVALAEAGWTELDGFPENFQFSKGTTVNKYKQFFKWLVPTAYIKYVKPANVTPPVEKPATTINAGAKNTGPVLIKIDENITYDSTKKVWNPFKWKEDITNSLYGWCVYIDKPETKTDEKVFGIIVGTSKAFKEFVIVAINETDVVQINCNTIKHVAPPGTPVDLLKKFQEEAKALKKKLVDDDPDFGIPVKSDMNLEEIGKMPYKEKAAVLNGNYVLIKQPKKVWTKVIGWIPPAAALNAFTVELPPGDNSGDDGGSMKPFIKYFKASTKDLSKKQLNVPFTSIEAVSSTVPSTWKNIKE